MKSAAVAAVLAVENLAVERVAERSWPEGFAVENLAVERLAKRSWPEKPMDSGLLAALVGLRSPQWPPELELAPLLHVL